MLKLISWCRIFLEKFTDVQLVKKFPASNGTQGSYYVPKHLPLGPILSKFNIVNTITIRFLKIYFICFPTNFEANQSKTLHYMPTLEVRWIFFLKVLQKSGLTMMTHKNKPDLKAFNKMTHHNTECSETSIFLNKCSNSSQITCTM